MLRPLFLPWSILQVLRKGVNALNKYFVILVASFAIAMVASISLLSLKYSAQAQSPSPSPETTESPSPSPSVPGGAPNTGLGGMS